LRRPDIPRKKSIPRVGRQGASRATPLRLFESEKSPVGALILQALWEMKEKRRTYRPGSLATKS